MAFGSLPSVAATDVILAVGDRSAPYCSRVLPEVSGIPLAFGVLLEAFEGLLVASATPRSALGAWDRWVAVEGPLAVVIPLWALVALEDRRWVLDCSRPQPFPPEVIT